MKHIYSVTKAYHSTRQKGLKKFESRTTTATIDTGEGAHVHGWGLYLQADEMENRKLYLDAFTGNASNTQGEDYHIKAWGKEFDAYCSQDICGINDVDSFTPYDFENAGLTAAEELYITLIINGFSDLGISSSLSGVIEDFNENDEDYPEILFHWTDDDLKEVIEMAYKGISDDFEMNLIEKEEPGTLPDGTHYEQASQYTVEIPDDMVFIDEYGHVPEYIAIARCKLGYYDPYAKIIESWWDDATEEQRNDYVRKYMTEMNFETFYRDLTHFFKSDEKASLWLSEQGIDGMTYEGGRDGGCFVIYNCDKLKIISEY